jgi:4-hydroxy-tetrahydrodipicolinate reductase
MKIIVVGLPGKVASEITASLTREELHPVAVASARHVGGSFPAARAGISVSLVGAGELSSSLFPTEDYVALDFSPNAEQYLELWATLKIPCVIGASALDPEIVRRTVGERGTLAVLAPNLAAPIVAVQSILRSAAREFPGVFEGFSWQCVESHQAGKKDVSGTARALLASFVELGFRSASVENIQSIRTPEAQGALGVPEEFLQGHGWHRYEGSKDGVTIALEHRTNGRAMYAEGAVRACRFASLQWKNAIRGRCFDMVDVLRGGAEGSASPAR